MSESSCHLSRLCCTTAPSPQCSSEASCLDFAPFCCSFLNLASDGSGLVLSKGEGWCALASSGIFAFTERREVHFNLMGGLSFQVSLLRVVCSCHNKRLLGFCILGQVGSLLQLSVAVRLTMMEAQLPFPISTGPSHPCLSPGPMR